MPPPTSRLHTGQDRASLLNRVPPHVLPGVAILKAEWERMYRAALTEHDSRLKWSRIEEARNAIVLRIKEAELTAAEREKLDRAIEMLNLLRRR